MGTRIKPLAGRSNYPLMPTRGFDGYRALAGSGSTRGSTGAFGAPTTTLVAVPLKSSGAPFGASFIVFNIVTSLEVSTTISVIRVAISET